jgi:hypothetical protein
MALLLRLGEFEGFRWDAVEQALGEQIAKVSIHAKSSVGNGIFIEALKRNKSQVP